MRSISASTSTSTSSFLDLIRSTAIASITVTDKDSIVTKPESLDNRNTISNNNPAYYYISNPNYNDKNPNKVLISCSNCKRAKTKCDNRRPCRRCESTNRIDSCMDSIHQKRGRKRSAIANIEEENITSTTNNNTNPNNSYNELLTDLDLDLDLLKRVRSDSENKINTDISVPITTFNDPEAELLLLDELHQQISIQLAQTHIALKTNVSSTVNNPNRPTPLLIPERIINAVNTARSTTIVPIVGLLDSNNILTPSHSPSRSSTRSQSHSYSNSDPDHYQQLH